MEGTLLRADVYAGRFPTSAGGYFEVEFTGDGKTLAGTAFSTEDAAQADPPMVLDVLFNAGPR